MGFMAGFAEVVVDQYNKGVDRENDEHKMQLQQKLEIEKEERTLRQKKLEESMTNRKIAESLAASAGRPNDKSAIDYLHKELDNGWTKEQLFKGLNSPDGLDGSRLTLPSSEKTTIKTLTKVDPLVSTQIKAPAIEEAPVPPGVNLNPSNVPVPEKMPSGMQIKAPEVAQTEEAPEETPVKTDVTTTNANQDESTEEVVKNIEEGVDTPYSNDQEVQDAVANTPAEKQAGWSRIAAEADEEAMEYDDALFVLDNAPAQIKAGINVAENKKLLQKAQISYRVQQRIREENNLANMRAAGLTTQMIAITDKNGKFIRYMAVTQEADGTLVNSEGNEFGINPETERVLTTTEEQRKIHGDVLEKFAKPQQDYSKMSSSALDMFDYGREAISVLSQDGNENLPSAATDLMGLVNEASENIQAAYIYATRNSMGELRAAAERGASQEEIAVLYERQMAAYQETKRYLDSLDPLSDPNKKVLIDKAKYENLKTMFAYKAAEVIAGQQGRDVTDNDLKKVLGLFDAGATTSEKAIQSMVQTLSFTKNIVDRKRQQIIRDVNNLSGGRLPFSIEQDLPSVDEQMEANPLIKYVNDQNRAMIEAGNNAIRGLPGFAGNPNQSPAVDPNKTSQTTTVPQKPIIWDEESFISKMKNSGREDITYEAYKNFKLFNSQKEAEAEAARRGNTEELYFRLPNGTPGVVPIGGNK